MAKITAVAFVLLATTWFGFSLLTGPVTPVVHAALLEPVWQATERAAAVHVVLRMRTAPNEDFPFADPELGFMRVEAWIESALSDDGGRIRIEKSNRIYTYDGTETVLFLPETREAYRGRGRAMDLDLVWPAAWVRHVRNLPAAGVEVLKHEENEGVGLLMLREPGVDTGPRRPAFLGEFERDTALEWDLESQRLQSLMRWIRSEGQWLLFSETLSIEYLPEIDPAIFDLELPDDVRWGGVAEGGIELLEMGPRAVALRLFEAALDGDRDVLELLCPSPATIDWLLAEENRPTAVYFVGEPFRAGNYAGVYVPYKVRFGSGPFTIKEHNLALRNDNAQNRWVFDGGV